MLHGFRVHAPTWMKGVRSFSGEMDRSSGEEEEDEVVLVGGSLPARSFRPNRLRRRGLFLTAWTASLTAFCTASITRTHAAHNTTQTMAG